MTKLFENKYLFFTYAQVSVDCTKEEVLRQLTKATASQNRELLYYIVAKENHKDGGIHFHAYLEVDIPIASRNIKLFNLILPDLDLHPNV